MIIPGVTVTTALQWAVALMVKHQDVQEKVFQQIKDVVGLNRSVRLADRADLPLVEATIYEAR